MEEFYAAVKLTTGEEILGEVMYDEEDDFIIISNAIEVEEDIINPGPGIYTQIFTPRMWMRFSGEDTFVINRDKIVTISELNHEAIHFYNKCFEKAVMSKSQYISTNKVSVENNVGYVSSIDDARSTLERLYKRYNTDKL